MGSDMNIFFMGYSLKEDSGGIENYTFTILKHLKKQGHNIIVYTLNDSNEIFENVTIKRIKLLDDLILGKMVGSQLRNKYNNIDLFLCGHLFLAKQMEQIVSNYKHGYYLFAYGIECWAGRFAKKYPALKNLDKIISISSFTTKQISDQGFNGEIVYVPPVIDKDKYNIKSDQKTINDGKIKLITVARLSSQEQYKGHDNVIEAVKLLRDKGIENFEYRIVGKGDDQKRLEEKVNSYDLNAFIKFYGFVDDKKLGNIYQDSDIFIMPSNVSLDPKKPEGEGFGIVFIEAAIYGLALIGPNNGGPTDIIEHGVNGYLCDPKSVEDIAEKIIDLMQNEKRRNCYGTKIKEKTMDNFTLNQLDKYLSNLIDD